MAIDDLQVISGVDIPIIELGLTLKQPKIREIALMGEQNYFSALQLFRMNKHNLRIADPNVNDWNIFQNVLQQKSDGVKNIRVLVTNFLQLFFVEKVNIGPRSIIIDKGSELINIENENFSVLQAYVKRIGGDTILSPPEVQFNTKSKLAAEIAEKMKKAHKRLAAEKNKNRPKSAGFIAGYIKALSIQTANSLDDILNMTLLQLDELMQKYLDYESYDIEVRSRLAGAKGDGKIEHWIARSKETNKSVGEL